MKQEDDWMIGLVVFSIAFTAAVSWGLFGEIGGAGRPRKRGGSARCPVPSRACRVRRIVSDPAAAARKGRPNPLWCEGAGAF